MEASGSQSGAMGRLWNIREVGPCGVLRILKEVPLKGGVELQSFPHPPSFPDLWFCSTTSETEGLFDHSLEFPKW